MLRRWPRCKCSAYVITMLVVINCYIVFIGRRYFGTYYRRDYQSYLQDFQTTTRRICPTEKITTLKYQNKTAKTQRQINNDRLAHIAEVCKKYNDHDKNFRKLKSVGYVHFLQQDRLAFCETPKVGCTYWKQMLRYMVHDYPGDVDTPEEIPRYLIHFKAPSKISKGRLNNPKDVARAEKAKYKFMITRDPYSRLWSAYIDKLVLPDFWSWMGTGIVKQLRKNATEFAKKCGHDVTFSEYIQHIVSKVKRGPNSVDHHFAPIYGICNPCKLNFDTIGKIETMGADTEMILNETGFGYIINDTHARKKDRAKLEIEMLTIYNMEAQDFWLKKTKKECIQQPLVAQRIWKTFQYNGYIGDEIAFPETELANITSRTEMQEVLLSKLLTVLNNASKEDAKRWRGQRKSHLEFAYKGISQKLKEDIRDLYEKDFELFQYDREPQYVFSP